MPQYTQATLLAETLDQTRSLTRWYLSLLKTVDMKHRFEVNGALLNSPLWIAAHLCWAENSLILTSTGGKPSEEPWLNDFMLGAEYDVQSLPDTKIILDTMKNIHQASMEHLASLSDESLDEPNLTGLSFGTNNSKRMMIMHAIRHEGTHIGHLSWICKLHGISTV